jgi:hypothetical protein
MSITWSERHAFECMIFHPQALSEIVALRRLPESMLDAGGRDIRRISSWWHLFDVVAVIVVVVAFVAAAVVVVWVCRLQLGGFVQAFDNIDRHRQRSELVARDILHRLKFDESQSTMLVFRPNVDG